MIKSVIVFQDGYEVPCTKSPELVARWLSSGRTLVRVPSVGTPVHFVAPALVREVRGLEEQQKPKQEWEYALANDMGVGRARFASWREAEDHIKDPEALVVRRRVESGDRWEVVVH